MKQLLALFAVLGVPLLLVGQCRDGYRAPFTFPTGQNPGRSTTAELVTAGYLDYAFVNGPDSIQIRFGSFGRADGQPFVYPVGPDPRAVAAGDFTGDRKPDVVIAVRGYRDIALLAQGSPSGEFAVTHRWPTGVLLTAIATVDINRDGIPDIIYGGDDGSGIIYGNQALPRVHLPFASIDYIAAGQGANGVPLAVFTTANQLVVLRLDGPPGNPLTDAHGFFLGSGSHPVVFTDFNGDGKRDIAVAQTGEVRIYLGDDLGNASAPTSIGVPGDLVALAGGDIDKDGQFDLGVSVRNGGIVPLYGRSGGAFEVGPSIATPHSADSLGIVMEPYLPKPFLFFVDSQGSSLSILVPCIDPIPPTTTITTSPAVNADGWQRVPFMLEATAADNPGGSGVEKVYVTSSGPIAYPYPFPYFVGTFYQPIEAEGRYQFTFSAVDKFGNAEPTRTVTVGLDLTPPVVDGVFGSATIIANNHKLVPAAVVYTYDAFSGIPPGGVSIEVTSNEPIDGTGDGDTAPDWIIDGDVVYVRAERASQGNGRVYTITARATDRAGNTTTGVRTVTIPK